MMLIKNIYTFENGNRILKNLNINSEEEVSIFDAEAKHTLLPGLFDVHVHGYGGFDFADVGHAPHTIPLILQALGETGLSYVMATLVSLDLNNLAKCLKAIDSYVQSQGEQLKPGMTKIVGVHLEGPFISKKYRGAHAEENLQSEINLRLFEQIISVAPHITEWKITLAPDLPGAEEFIKEINNRKNKNISVKISLGHSNPSKSSIENAIAAGAIGFTHLGNACGESCSRANHSLEKNHAQSQLVQWVLENPEKCPAGVEVIVDNVHLSPSFVKLIKKTLGDKLILITDALGPANCKDGLYQFAQQCIRKEENHFYLSDAQGNFKMRERTLQDGSKLHEKILSGSGVSLAQCIEHYTASLDSLDIEEKMRSLYAALITNPRQTSLSTAAIANLADTKNFSIFNDHGKLIVSLCNGKIIEFNY